MSNFDEWFENNYWQLSADIDEANDTYKAGAASRQAEIDALNALGEMSEQNIDDLVLRNIELQKRIDEIKNHIDINYDGEREDDQHSYWSGYNQALREMDIVLNGEGESK